MPINTIILGFGIIVGFFSVLILMLIIRPFDVMSQEVSTSSTEEPTYQEFVTGRINQSPVVRVIKPIRNIPQKPVNLDEDAVSGLVNLGYGKRVAIQMVTKYQQPDMSTEEIIRKTLAGDNI